MNRAALTALAAMAVALVVAGCTGPNAYRSVDLGRDLSQQDIDRYEKEWQAVKAQGGTRTIESTNGWPLGILLYWDRGTVVRKATEPVEYHVRTTTGFGPLSILYVSETHSTYSGAGKLMSTMTMSSVLGGHIAMFHSSETLLPDGRRQQANSSHWIHHLINFHAMDGHTATSLLTGPNIIGVESHDPAACH